MKVKLSITLDEKTLRLIEEHVNSQRFRNKSHAVEFAVRKLLEQKIANQQKEIPEQKAEKDSENDASRKFAGNTKLGVMQHG
jgi:Arc/MetJ-type ribon-helix-helix transcriptional regulator